MPKDRHHSRVLPPDEPRQPFPLAELVFVLLIVALIIALWTVAP